MKKRFYLMLAFALSFSAYANDNNTGLVVDGVTWAATNVGDYQTFATRPDMYTKFYQWNRAKAWPTTNVHPRELEFVLDTVWTINPCPPGWRLPTVSEWEALAASGHSWAAVGTRGNAVPGSFLGPNHATASLPDSMAGAIFMPANCNHNAYDSVLVNICEWGSWTKSYARGSALSYRVVGVQNANYWLHPIIVDSEPEKLMTLRCVK